MKNQGPLNDCPLKIFSYMKIARYLNYKAAMDEHEINPTF